jgi:hypothetical protein
MAVAVALAFRFRPHPSAPGASPSAPVIAALPCATNKDCEVAGGATVCGRAGVCVPQRGCATNKECIDKAGGKAAICRRDEGACVPLETAECRQLLMEKGNVENDATVWIGAMIPDGGPASNSVRIVLETLDLARKDFASMARGIPGPRSGDPPRPIAILRCDDTEPNAPAHHLVEAVGVPAIIGFGRNQDLMDLAGSLFNPKGVLAVAALNRAPALTTIPPSPEGPRLVWRTNTNASSSAALIAAFIGETLATRFSPQPDPLLVAVARVDNLAYLAAADKLVSSLRVRGKSVAQGGAVVRQFVLDAEHPDIASTRREILEMAPHVIVYMTQKLTDRDDFLPQIEREWPAAVRHRPFYVGAHGGSGPLRLPAVRKDVWQRMFTVDAPASLPANVKLAIRYNEAYGQKLAPADTIGVVYDAFYVVAYALAALGDKPVTGVNLARALPRLSPPGVPIEVGPAAIPEALKVLREGRAIDLDGSSTSLDFDPETGDPPATYVVLCLKPGAKSGTFEAVESGIMLDGRIGKLEGKLSCP